METDGLGPEMFRNKKIFENRKKSKISKSKIFFKSSKIGNRKKNNLENRKTKIERKFFNKKFEN